MTKSLLVLLAFMLSFPGLGQEHKVTYNDPSPYYLRNYQAPDFKLRRLQVSLNGQGQGLEVDTLSIFQFNSSNHLSFFSTSNNADYQGQMQGQFSSGMSISRNVQEVFALNLGSFISSKSQNRFYFKDDLFFGLHDLSSLSATVFFTDNPMLENNGRFNLSVRPALSIGRGRLEPVHFARQALDIERLLINGNRLTTYLSDDDRNKVADKIAQVSNKRIYDSRISRIYQLQAIDSVLRDMNLVNDFDFVYFTQLQDAYLYSSYFNRLDGTRHELGVTQGFNYGMTADSDPDWGAMSYGYYSFSRHLAQSYAIQHSFVVSLIGGLRIDNGGRDIPVWLDADYTLGFYPNTRTYFSVAPGAGIYHWDGNYGIAGSASVDAYYYIAPRTRFRFSGQFLMGNNYQTHGFFHVATSNVSLGAARLNYRFDLGFTYDIF